MTPVPFDWHRLFCLWRTPFIQAGAPIPFFPIETTRPLCYNRKSTPWNI